MQSDDQADEDLDLDRALRLDALAAEFSRELASGSTVSPLEFADRHPEVREELLAVLRGLALLAGRPGPVGPLRKGQTIGPYAIRGELGRGGMGVVYEAVEEDLGRVVALKAMDASRVDAKFRSRFQREARAAARLDHPGIVPVFGSGEDGATLWYAMRRVEGVALDAVLDAMSSPADSRSRIQVESTLAEIDSSRSAGSLREGTPQQRAAALIAMRIAEALAYAHAEGVLHRDVKPGNVMLDRDGTPLLTDFGLCKLEGDASLTADTDIVGTLRYLPPEALNGRADGRGDVYGVGLVLYELLARRPAFVVDDRAQMLQRVMHEDPEPLHKVVSGVPEDLERIVVKATAKLPEERYATAGDLAEDLDAFLTGQPVRARAPSALYLARLFVKRNRALAAGFVALIIVLVAGITGTSVGFARAVDARELAEEKEAIAAAELAKAEQVTTFLRSVLAGSSPWIAAGRDTDLLRSILDDAAAEIEGTLEDQPEAEILIRTTIGGAYRELGDLDSASRHLERAARLAGLHLEPAAPEFLEARRSLGHLELDRSNPDAAEDQFDTNLRYRPLRIDDPDAGALRDFLGQLGVLDYRFEREEIVRLTGEVLPAALDSFGQADPVVQQLQNVRARSLVFLGRFDEAGRLYAALLEQRGGQYGDDHPYTMSARSGLASVARRQGRLDDARALQEAAVASASRVFGEAHRTTANAKNSLALLHRDRGRLDLAVDLLAEVLEVNEASLGETHTVTLTTMFNYANVLEQLGRFDEAGAMMRRRLDVHRAHYGPAHKQTLMAQVNLAVQRMHSGEVDESLMEYEAAIEAARGVDGFDPGFLGFFLLRYGQGLSAQSEEQEGAENVVLEAWDLLEDAYTTDSSSCRDAALTMVLIYERLGRPDEAARWAKTAESIGADLAALDRWR